jgi:hypothetical protein
MGCPQTWEGRSPGSHTFVVQGSVYGCDSLNRAILSVPHLEKSGRGKEFDSGEAVLFPLAKLTAVIQSAKIAEHDLCFVSLDNLEEHFWAFNAVNKVIHFFWGSHDRGIGDRDNAPMRAAFPKLLHKLIPEGIGYRIAKQEDAAISLSHLGRSFLWR